MRVSIYTALKYLRKHCGNLHISLYIQFFRMKTDKYAMHYCLLVAICPWPIYSRTLMAQTPFEPWKDVRDRGSSSLQVLIMVPGQDAK